MRSLNINVRIDTVSPDKFLWYFRQKEDERLGVYNSRLSRANVFIIPPFDDILYRALRGERVEEKVVDLWYKLGPPYIGVDVSFPDRVYYAIEQRQEIAKRVVVDYFVKMFMDCGARILCAISYGDSEFKIHLSVLAHAKVESFFDCEMFDYRNGALFPKHSKEGYKKILGGLEEKLKRL